MKKLLLLLIFAGFGLVSQAQETQTKVKPTTTVPQKVHNTFSKHKKHKGYKAKKKHNGVTHKRKVDYKKGEVKNKTTD